MNRWILAGLAATVVTSLRQLRGGDLLWHIRVGDYIRQTGSLLTQDVFSYTFVGQPVMPHSPLFQIIVSFIHESLGWPGLTFFRIIFCLLVFGLLLNLFCRTLKLYDVELTPNRWPLVLALPAIILICDSQLGLHPQMFFFIFVLALLVLGPYPKPTKTYGQWHHRGIFLILLAWPWLHPSFVTGYGIVATFIIGSIIAKPNGYRKHCLIWTASIVGNAITLWLLAPDIISNVISHSASPVMLATIKYWQPLWQHLNWSLSTVAFLTVFCGVFAGYIFLVMSRRHKDTIFLHLFALPALLASLFAVRFYPAFLLGVAPIALTLLNRRRVATLSVAFLASIYVIGIYSGHYKLGVGLDKTRLPVDCVDFLEKQDIKGNVLNAYNYGGYLIYRFSGEKKVFIDPRSVQVYSDDFIAKLIQLYKQPTHIESLQNKWNITHSILPTTSNKTQKLIQHLSQSDRWQIAFQGQRCIIHTKLGD